MSARDSISSSRLAKMLAAAAEAETRASRSKSRSLSCVISAKTIGLQRSACDKGIEKNLASEKRSETVLRHALTVPGILTSSDMTARMLGSTSSVRERVREAGATM